MSDLNNYIDSDFPVAFPDSKSYIKVIGVGGGGCNVVKAIYNSSIKDVDMIICNTDEQSLNSNPVYNRIKLGRTGSRGLGAGCDPKKGRQAALDSIEDIKAALDDDSEMIFVTACLGGGTGTGAAPVIAKQAKDAGKLVVAVVTIPFRDEGEEFLSRAMEGLKEVRKYVDSILIIDNQKIYDTCSDLTIEEAWDEANKVLVTAVKSITEIITKEGMVNVDMNDVKMVMTGSGTTTLGIGMASGPDRAMEAVRQAFDSPLLSDCKMETSTGLLVCMTCNSFKEAKMNELQQIVEHAKSYTGKPGKFKRGLYEDNTLGDNIIVTIVATGFELLNLPVIQNNDKVYVGNADTNTSDVKSIDDGNTITIKKLTGADNQEISEAPYKRGQGKPVLVADDDQIIRELENEPAYLRKDRRNKGLSNSHSTADSAEIGLFSTEGQSFFSSTDNSFLHKTQD